jgi:hypothetical protein
MVFPLSSNASASHLLAPQVQSGIELSYHLNVPIILEPHQFLDMCSLTSNYGLIINGVIHILQVMPINPLSLKTMLFLVMITVS